MRRVSQSPGSAGNQKGLSELGPKKRLSEVSDQKRCPHQPCQESNHPCHHLYGQPRVPIAEHRACRKYKRGWRRMFPPIT